MKHIQVQGERVPALGFGTYKLRGNECIESVADAIAIGYRHIDTASVYENETETGAGIRKSGVPRSDVFLTTKVWWTDLEPQGIRNSLDESLRRLQMDYVDLLLLHWPAPNMDMNASLGELVRIRKEGKARLVGVSNFPPGLLRKALEAEPTLANIQVEYHPMLGQDRLLEIVAANEMFLTAYSPFGQGKLLDEPVLKQIAAKHNKGVAQVCLRWLLGQEKVAAIPKAASHKHRVSNFDVFGFEFDAEDLQAIAALDKTHRFVRPQYAPDWDL